jgi:site-specific DNA recombinase
MNGLIIAVLYYRVSTEEQGKKGFSLPEQRRECLAKAQSLAAAKGAQLQIYEFEDTASGEILDRPGLTACRTFIRSNLAHYFVCLDPDRFSRSLFNALLVTQEIEQRGLELVFVQHDYQNTPEGRLFYQLRGAVSEFEKAKIQERAARGRKGKLAAGGIPNRVQPWGYQWDSVAKTLRIDEKAAPWVVRMFELYADGASYQRIADEFTALGVPPCRSQCWYKTAIQRMLRNPVYKGDLVLNKWDCTGLGPLKRVPREKRRPLTMTPKSQEEWVTVRVPAIISEELWQRAQTQNQNRTRLMQRGVGLLSGLCVCGLCGNRVHYMGDPKHRYLRCIARYPRLRDARPDLRKTPACTWTDVKSAGFERAIWTRVGRWLEDPEALSRERKHQQEAATQAEAPDQRVAFLQQELAARKDEHRRVFYLAAKGLAPEGVERDLERLQAQVKALEAELESITARHQRNQAEEAAEMASIAELAAQVQGELDSLDLQGRQKVVRALIRQVIVWPVGRFDYTLK